MKCVINCSHVTVSRTDRNTCTNGTLLTRHYFCKLSFYMTSCSRKMIYDFTDMLIRDASLCDIVLKLTQRALHFCDDTCRHFIDQQKTAWRLSASHPASQQIPLNSADERLLQAHPFSTFPVRLLRLIAQITCRYYRPSGYKAADDIWHGAGGVHSAPYDVFTMCDNSHSMSTSR